MPKKARAVQFGQDPADVVDDQDLDEHSDFADRDRARDFVCDCCGVEAWGYPSGDTWAACRACERACTRYRPCDRWRP